MEAVVWHSEPYNNKYFVKQESKMDNKYMEKHSASIPLDAIGKYKLKFYWGFIFFELEWLTPGEQTSYVEKDVVLGKEKYTLLLGRQNSLASMEVNMNVP